MILTVVDVPTRQQCSRGPAHRDALVGSFKNQPQGTTPCPLTLLGANPSTNTYKDVLRVKYLITKLLDGLEVFLGVGVMSWNSNKFQITGMRHIYSPPTQKSSY